MEQTTDWDEIMREAAVVEQLLLLHTTDLNEAEKAMHFFISNGYNEIAMQRYLGILSKNPPERSKKSLAYYRQLEEIWSQWQPALIGVNKARAWGWGIRLVKSSNRQG